MKRPARPGILARAAVALGIARTDPTPPIAATVARAEAVDAETLEASPVAAVPVAAAVAPACGRRRRRASPGEVAEGVARALINDGLAGYPMLPEDIDEAAAAWCKERGLSPAPTDIVREALATLPGVNRARTRLRAGDAAHVAIARRLRRMGRQDGRATLFTIKAVRTVLQGNPSPDSTSARTTAAGRGKLALGVIAAAATESASCGAAASGGGPESVARPVVRRSA